MPVLLNGNVAIESKGTGRRPAVRKAKATEKEAELRNSTGTQSARKMPFVPQGEPALQGRRQGRSWAR
jgi:hypothetical protein